MSGRARASRLADPSNAQLGGEPKGSIRRERALRGGGTGLEVGNNVGLGCGLRRESQGVSRSSLGKGGSHLGRAS